MPVVTIKRVDPDAVIPTQTFNNDSGFDLHSVEERNIAPLDRCLFRTGICLSLPSNIRGEVRSRSGLALKHGIAVLNSPGTIDPGYRGEILVLLINLSSVSYFVERGDGIAQLVFSRQERFRINETLNNKDTDRGSFSFGSG